MKWANVPEQQFEPHDCSTSIPRSGRYVQEANAQSRTWAQRHYGHDRRLQSGSRPARDQHGIGSSRNGPSRTTSLLAGQLHFASSLRYVHVFDSLNEFPVGQGFSVVSIALNGPLVGSLLNDKRILRQAQDKRTDGTIFERLGLQPDLSILQEIPSLPCPLPLPMTLPPSLRPSPIFTMVNWRLKSVPPPSPEPSQSPRANTPHPNATPPNLSNARQNHQYHPQNSPVRPHSPPRPAQHPTQMNGNEWK